MLWAVELPFSVARWLSIPSSDGEWDWRRKWLSMAALPGASLLLLLEASNLRGGDVGDALGWRVGGVSGGESSGVSGGVPAWSVALGVGGALGVLLGACPPSRRPRAYGLLVAAGFASVVAWLDLLANEVVAVIQCVGVSFGLSTSVLGLTLVAVGNSVGDLIADTAVARRGDVRMAVASCFGSPLLNDIIGLGLSLTVHALRYGPMASPLSKQCRLAYCFLYPALLASLIAFPANGFTIGPRVAAALLALYLLFMSASVLVETGTIPAALLCWA